MPSPSLAAVGSVSANETYLGNRLSYADTQHVEEPLSGTVSWQEALSILTRAFLASIVAFVIISIPLAVIVVAGAVSGGSSRSYGDSSGVGALLGSGVALFAAFAPILAFLVSFFIPRRDLLSEWQTLLDDRGAAADSVYAAVYSKLRERRLPVQVRARRLRLTGGARVNNYLLISEGRVTAYVTSFAYGTSLYLGWSLWTRRLPIAMLGRFIFDGAGTGNRAMRGMLRSSSVRALREAVHSAAREGLDVAAAGIDIPLAVTFGHDVAIETLDAAPNPAGPPMPPRPAVRPAATGSAATWGSPNAGAPARPPMPPAPPAPPVSSRPPTPPAPPSAQAASQNGGQA